MHTKDHHSSRSDKDNHGKFTIEDEITTFQRPNSCSKSAFSQNELNSLLNDWEEEIAQDHQSILQPSLYAKLKQFCLEMQHSSNENAERIAKFVETISIGLSGCKSKSTSLQSIEKYVLLAAHSVHLLFAAATSSTSSTSAVATSSSKKSNSANSNTKESLALSRAKSKLVCCLLDFLKPVKNHSFPWEFGDVLLKCLCKIPNSFLENALITGGGNEFKNNCNSEVKKALVSIYCLLSKQFPLCQLAFKSFLTESFQHFDEIGEFVAEIVASACMEFQLDAFGNEIILNVVEPSSSSLNEVFIKNLIGFLSGLTKSIPKAIHRNLSMICQLLDVEAHSLRIGILECIYTLISTESNDSTTIAEDAGERGSKQNEKSHSLMNVLFERILDVNSFVRAKTLTLLCSLCSEGRMNASMVELLWNSAADRLHDKASNVRRRALIVLSEILKKHPFSFDGGQLNAQIFRVKLAQCEEAIEKSNESQLDALLVQKKYYNDACRFAEKVKIALIFVRENFLYCQNKTEVNEAIEFICVCQVYQIEGSTLALGKTLPLVWSKDSSGDDESRRSIRENLIAALKIVIFEGSNSQQIAQNLMSFHQSHWKAYSETVDEILHVFCEKKFIHHSTLEHLYNAFLSSSFLGFNALSVLVIVTSAGSFAMENAFISSERINAILADSRVKMQPEYATLACKLIGSTCNAKFDYQLISKFLGEIILSSSNSPSWIPAIQAAIDVFFLISAQPIPQMESIVKKMHLSCTNSSSSSTFLLAKLIFVIGHATLKIDGHLSRLQHRQQSQKKEKKPKNSSSIEEHVATATFDDSIGELFALIRERELLFSPNALLAPFRALILWIVNHPERFKPNSILYSLSVLSLAKLMATSEEFCRQQLPLFLQLLVGTGNFSSSTSSTNYRIQSNLVVAFGDFCTSFPSLMDEHIVLLYERLLDPSIRVRINSLLVLSWLILNGMIKVKGQLHLIALCFLDSDSRISQLSQTFFQDLATKDPNAIYNAIPDLISNLSSHFPNQQPEFTQIMRQVFGLLKRERQIENVLCKIIARLTDCMCPRVGCNLFACLFLLFQTAGTASAIAEVKIMEKIIETFSVTFASRLDYLEIPLRELAAKAKKNDSLAALAQQLESLIEDVHKEKNEDTTMLLSTSHTQQQQQQQQSISTKMQEEPIVKDDDSQLPTCNQQQITVSKVKPGFVTRLKAKLRRKTVN